MYTPPTQRSEEEDKSTWFTTDKRKFRFKVEEYSFTIKSTHSRPHLVLMSEYVPRSAEEDIKVELLSPSMKEVEQIADSSGNGDDLLNEILNKYEIIPHNGKTQAFYSDSSKMIVWAVNIAPGETVNLKLRYRISWPDGKTVETESYSA